jgi:hypothetical protein
MSDRESTHMYGLRATDVVGYTADADIYCPACAAVTPAAHSQALTEPSGPLLDPFMPDAVLDREE